MSDLLDESGLPEIPESQRLGRCKNGVDWNLEEYADEMLAQARREVPRSQDDDPYEVLSVGQLDRRRSREIYNRNGFPEPHLYSGLYRRAYNPVMADRKRGSWADAEGDDSAPTHSPETLTFFDGWGSP